MNQFILALCGLPASGKSTLADAIKQSLDYDVEIVRTDEWRDAVYYTDWAPENERPVREKAIAKVRELISNGKHVIHDDTNYYTSMRHELFDIAVEHRCGFAIIHVSTPVSVALRWNRERSNSPIPDYVIKDISERFDKPGRRYLWDDAELEVDMERENLTTVVPQILEILKNLEAARKPRPRMVTSSEYNRLDTETRLVVSKFLQEHPHLRGNREVSVIRRSVMRECNERKIPVKDVEKILRAKLSSLL
jgi:O-phosphoseryl-tRNA(Sec) kinase